MLLHCILQTPAPVLNLHDVGVLLKAIMAIAAHSATMSFLPATSGTALPEAL